MSKKILGLSFGRKMGNCEVMVKQALMACKEADHEIRFIRVNDLDIKDCTGCIGCVVSMISGRSGKCHLKDDCHILDDAIMECDGLIVGCPTFEIGPTGTFRTVCDRFGPSHDISFRKVAIEEGLAAGKDPATLPDQRCLKKRVAAIFSVGGAMTRNWITFTLPSMYALPMTMGIDVVDTYEYWGAMAFNNVVGNEPVMERMTAMGKHVAEAVVCDDDDPERTRFRGDREGACPVCHCDFLTLSDDKKSIECPVCGIYGSFTVEGGTPICAWMPRQAVLDNGGAVYVEEYEKALEGLDLEDYEKRFRKDPNSQRADQLADPVMRYDIHPKKKRPVGERLALLALNKVYGRSDLLCEAPRLSELSVEDGALTLRFDDSGGGLYLSDTTPYGEPAPKTCAGWLRVFRNGMELDGSALLPIAQGDSLMLRSAAFRIGDSCRAELALTGWYQVPLYNSAGIPARPGRIETK